MLCLKMFMITHTYNLESFWVVYHCTPPPCREWSIEKALDKMMTDWEGLTFELGPWKETGGSGWVRRVVRGADWQLIDAGDCLAMKWFLM
jgi:hypothetical protein